MSLTANLIIEDVSPAEDSCCFVLENKNWIIIWKIIYIKSHANLLVHAQNVLHESWPLCKGKLQHGTLKMWPLAALQRWPSYRRSFDLKCVWEDHHVAVKKGDRVIEVTVMTGLTVQVPSTLFIFLKKTRFETSLDAQQTVSHFLTMFFY